MKGKLLWLLLLLLVAFSIAGHEENRDIANLTAQQRASVVARW